MMCPKCGHAWAPTRAEEVAERIGTWIGYTMLALVGTLVVAIVAWAVVVLSRSMVILP